MNQTPPNPTRRHGMAMFILMWVTIIGLFALLFQGWYERTVNPNRQVRSLHTSNGMREVALERNRYGHYVVSGHINDYPVVFMLDTGATDVVVPARIARRIGLSSGAEIMLQTANGQARGYLTRLQTIRIGNIEMQDVRATINPNVSDDEILLGMSFLKQIEFTQKGNTLTLRQRNPATNAQ